MALAALIVSVVSACAALGAIGVAIWTHVQQGSHVTCKLRKAVPIGAGQTWEIHIAVNAVNDGRASTTIEGWGFALLNRRGKPTDTHLFTPTASWQPSLPYRLDSESSVSWMTPTQSIRDAISGQEPYYGLKGFVRTGADHMVYSDQPVNLD